MRLQVGRSFPVHSPFSAMLNPSCSMTQVFQYVMPSQPQTGSNAAVVAATVRPARRAGSRRGVATRLLAILVGVAVVVVRTISGHAAASGVAATRTAACHPDAAQFQRRPCPRRQPVFRRCRLFRRRRRLHPTLQRHRSRPRCRRSPCRPCRYPHRHRHPSCRRWPCRPCRRHRCSSRRSSSRRSFLPCSLPRSRLHRCRRPPRLRAKGSRTDSFRRSSTTRARFRRDRPLRSIRPWKAPAIA